MKTAPKPLFNLLSVSLLSAESHCSESLSMENKNAPSAKPSSVSKEGAKCKKISEKCDYSELKKFFVEAEQAIAPYENEFSPSMEKDLFSPMIYDTKQI